MEPGAAGHEAKPNSSMLMSGAVRLLPSGLLLDMMGDDLVLDLVVYAWGRIPVDTS